MFILYKLKDQFTIGAQKYTKNAEKAIKNAVFKRYLFQAIGQLGICIKIKCIQLQDNIILSKEATIFLTLGIEVVILSLSHNQYHQATLINQNSEALQLNVMGILSAIIPSNLLHNGTICLKKSAIDEEKNASNLQWTLPYHTQQAFSWCIGDKINIRIQLVDWKSKKIIVKANKEGLGPCKWWVNNDLY